MIQDEKVREKYNTTRNWLEGAGGAALAAGLPPGLRTNPTARMIQTGTLLGVLGLKHTYDGKITHYDIQNHRLPRDTPEAAEGKKMGVIGYGIAGAGAVLGFHNKIANGGPLVKYTHAGITAGALALGAYGHIKRNNNS